MKRIFSHIAALAMLCIAVPSCSPDDFFEPNAHGIPLAADYEDAVTISIDNETNQVTFNLNSKGCMPVWIFDGKNYSTVNGLQKIYTLAGEYSVDVKIANANGISEGTFTKTFRLENTIVDFSKYITLLSGGEAKEWRIAKDEAAHLGCGPTGTDGTEWYGAAPNEKADMGLYDDVLTFDSEQNYTYNPGEGGTVFVNTGCSVFSQFNTNDGNDFMATVEEQKATYDFDVVGNDLFITLPPKTLFPYIPFDASYERPRFKVLNMTPKRMELVAENADIAWHFTLTTEVGAQQFNGFKFDSEFNLWKNANLAEPTFWYAPGWAQIADPAYTFANNTYSVVLPEATSEQWQAQMKIATDIAVSSSASYDFSVLLTASQDHGKVTVKLTDSSSDDSFLFAETIKLKAFEETVFYLSDVAGIDASALTLVLDFGGNAAGTEMTVKNVVLKDHSNDDGTVLPSVEEPVEEDVVWNDDAANNLWKQGEIESTFFYYAPGWAQIADPAFTADNFTYSVVLPTATTDQWQAQVHLRTNISTSAADNYDFKCTLTSTTDHGGATIKLVLNGDENTFYFAEKVKLTAYEPYTFKMVNLPGIDMEKVDLVFDFGGNAENTEVTISDVVLQKHTAPLKVEWDAASAANMWNSMEYTHFFYYAPGWAQIANPAVTANGNSYTIVLPTATTDQWQAQVAFQTNMSTSADRNYDFHCKLNANQNLKNVTVKLVLNGEGNDGVFYFTEQVNLTAYEDYEFEMIKMPGMDMNAVDLFFDFGGNPDNTEVTVSDIILQESAL